ncbi:hypothetical protein NKG94_09295 [Micromonospora sp. M12]
MSKAAIEALARLYADKFDLSVVCLRIGSVEESPDEARYLATWLSPRDCAGFIRAASTAPAVSFVTAYAVSANTRRFWDVDAGIRLGYTPVDNAEDHAANVRAPRSTSTPTLRRRRVRQRRLLAQTHHKRDSIMYIM